jgi:surfactin synthase thioesterase subunit
VASSDLEAWQRETKGAFALRVFEGDHFFVHAQSAAFTSAVTKDLGAVVDSLEVPAWSA